MTVLLGLLYPALVFAIGRVMPARTNGSLVAVDGTVVGSSLLAQGFDTPEYFWPQAVRRRVRPTGHWRIQPGARTTPDLVQVIEERRAAVAAANDVPVDQVPADAVTASASGLDPHISPEYAALQVARVAGARGLGTDVVADLVADHTQGRALGVLGEAGSQRPRTQPGPRCAGQDVMCRTD